MLSILIPIYNYDVSGLVEEIHRQSIRLKIDFEIILVDDFSTIRFESNLQLAMLDYISYEELVENYGRAKIRNFLAEKAKFENIIFLDCDSGVVSSDFIENYILSITNNIVYGGTVYANIQPEQEYYFHWYYGKTREAKSASMRRKNPNKGFHTNNFMIKKDLFLKIKFNEEIKGYGHEDTLFGYELSKQSIEIKHIDNPVVHLGLEKTDIFIQKTKNGLENLLLLTRLFLDEKKLFEDIKVLRYFFISKKFYFCSVIKILYILFNSLIMSNLKGKKPKLFLFDFYKLGFLCSRH